MNIKNHVLIIMTAMFLLVSGVAAAADEQALPSKITFYVGWYDVGKSALEGLKGVIAVKNGFRRFREINTVTYDPNQITPDEMVAALKAAGTYIETAKE